MAASETLYERLRRLAVEDPKTARNVFLEAFEANNNDAVQAGARLASNCACGCTAATDVTIPARKYSAPARNARRSFRAIRSVWSKRIS